MINEIEKDIVMNAGYLIANGEINIEDSRDFINNIIPKLAEEFKHTYDESDDYLISVDKFSIDKLVEIFGV